MRIRELIAPVFVLACMACGGSSDSDGNEEESTATSAVGEKGSATARRNLLEECTEGGNCEDRCEVDADCSTDGWACTQGGRCVDPTGVESATAAIQADLDELPDSRALAVPYTLPANVSLRIDDHDGDGIGLRVGVPEGHHREAVVFDGRGSQLQVAPNIVGVRVEKTASYSKLLNLRIDPVAEQGDTPHEGIGVDVRAHGVRLENLVVARMGTGLRADSEPDDNGDGDALDPHEYSNQNSQQWRNLAFENCYQNAVYMHGMDTNAGSIVGVEVRGGAGIKDDSFLGNTWIGPSATGTTESSVAMTGLAQGSVVAGAQVDDASPAPQALGLSSLWVGGRGADRVEGHSARIGGQNARLRFTDPSGMEVNVPGSINSPLIFQHPTETREWALHFEDAWKTWMFAYANAGMQGWVYGWTSDLHNEGPAQEKSPE